CVNGYAYC
ncbi:Alanine racemase, biosynthetic, partial [Haemophilus influenzae]